MLHRIQLNDRKIPINISELHDSDEFLEELVDKLKYKLLFLQENNPHYKEKLEIISVEGHADGWEVTLYFRGEEEEFEVFILH